MVNVDSTISELNELNFDLTDEGEVESFLGIKIGTEKYGKIIMSQSAIIETIIKTLGLENDFKMHKTPAVRPPLQKYKD